MDRLKPAFGFADPTPPAAEKKREFKAAAPREIKRSLDPEAKIFVPSSGPKVSGRIQVEVRPHPSTPRKTGN